jgi:4-hydroxy-tetrahydrodipicolinate synthase
MASTLFKGIIAYPVTPFSEASGEVDTHALTQSIERLIADGVHAVAPLGSTGESAYLSDAEWDQVADESLRAVGKRVPVVVGISDLTTANAVRRARFAERAGADAVMVLPISYWKLSEQEIFEHYAAIAGSVGIPIMVYNNPATSGIDLTPQLIARLVREIDNVTMVKESTGDIRSAIRLDDRHAAKTGPARFCRSTRSHRWQADETESAVRRSVRHRSPVARVLLHH